MFDNQLIALIISTLIAGEAVADIPNTPILQAFQPTQQGVNVDPTLYLFKVGDRRFGWVERKDVWDEGAMVMRHQETQQYETTFQISALATQNPKTPNAYTASDILNLAAYILQSADAIATLEAQGVGILRVTDVRNPYFSNDKQRNQASPSFDFTLTHKQVILSLVPIVTTTEFNIKRV